MTTSPSVQRLSTDPGNLCFRLPPARCRWRLKSARARIALKVHIRKIQVGNDVDLDKVAGFVPHIIPACYGDENSRVTHKSIGIPGRQHGKDQRWHSVVPSQ